LNFVTISFGPSPTMLIDISYSYGRISYWAKTQEKVYIDKKEKYNKPAQETSNIWEMHVEIIPIIVSSLGTAYARSLEVLINLLLCDDKVMKKIGW
jgi:hypothetical protein